MSDRPLSTVSRTLTQHLTDAVQWSAPSEVSGRGVWVAVLAIAAPILVGAALGRSDVGFTVGLGAMLLAGESPAAETPSAAERPRPGSAIYPAGLAVIVATLIAPWPWGDLFMIALAGFAAAISGYSRPVGVAAIRFIVYLVLSVTLLESVSPHRGDAAIVFGLGALWNIAVRVILARKVSPFASPTRQPTPAQRRAYFRRTLRSVEGWQFTVRMVVGLGVASGLRHAFPAHHYTWIVLTTALLTQRQLEHVPVRVTQRSAGTLLGLLLTWVILLSRAPVWGLALTICALGTAAPLARARNYLLYGILATPVILLVMDIGKPIEPGLLIDRLAATLIGSAIVIILNVMMDRLISLPFVPTTPR